ncbi:MAG: hypothetical protein IIW78_00105 [Clostridia bacterium]|nr:hypothetical protein [Clostridia bacterium]
MKKSEKGRAWGMPCLMLACVFLADPTVALRDRLPDLIGYLLLFFGLSRLADLNDHFAESRKRIGRLIPIGVLQIPAELLLYRWLPAMEGSMNAYESPTWLLLCTFLLGLAKLFLLLPAMRDLWRGFNACAETAGCDALLSPSRRERTLFERMQRLSGVFLALGASLPLLPELTLLVTFDYYSAGKTDYPDWYLGGGGGQGMDLYAHVELFRLLVGLLLLLFGVIWLALALRALLRTGRDEGLRTHLSARYADEILPQTGMLKLRAFRSSFRLLKLGAVFSILFPLYFRSAFSDGKEGLGLEEVISRGLESHSYELLPSLFCAILIPLGVLSLGRLLPNKRGFLAFSLLPICHSAAQLWVNAAYMSRFTLKDALYLPEAYDAFFLLRILRLAEIASILALLLWLLLLLRRLLLAHTAVVYEGQDARALSDRATAALHGRLQKKLVASAILFALAALAAAAFGWLQLEHSDLWMLAALVGAVAVGVFFSFMQDLQEEVTATYAREGVYKAER